jgi:hypothetical protein
MTFAGLSCYRHIPLYARWSDCSKRARTSRAPMRMRLVQS